MTARPGFFRFLASHHFFSGLWILNFLSIQLIAHIQIRLEKLHQAHKKVGNLVRIGRR